MTDKPQIVEFASRSCNYTLFDVKWVPSSARFVSLGSHARGTGAFEICELDQGKITVVKALEKPSGFKCGTFGASMLPQRHLATGSLAGDLDVWDLDRPDAPVFHVKAHSSIVNAIDGCGGLGVGGGAPEIVTGGRDGAVKVWDQRQPDAPVADMSPDEGSDVRDCWAVAFGNSFDSERCVAAGYDNGDVKLFDLRTMSVRWEAHLPNGICSLEFDRKDIAMNKLLTTGLESKFNVFDLRTQHPKEGFASVATQSHKSTIWTGRHLPQNRDVFVTAGGNGSLHLWKYSYPTKRSIPDAEGVPMGVAGTLVELNRVGLSTQPINALDWHTDKLGLCVTAAFDQTIRVCVVTKLNLV